MLLGTFCSWSCFHHYLFGMCTWKSRGSNRALTRSIKHQHLHSTLPKIQDFALFCTQIHRENDKAVSVQPCKEEGVHFSSHTEPTGSRGLGLPDKLSARMWSLDAAPNPNLKSLLLNHHCLTILVCDGWLATAWSLTEQIRYLSKMRVFNLVSGRNPALGGIKHRFNNPNNSFCLKKKINLICNLGVFSICYPELRLQPCCSFAVT